MTTTEQDIIRAAASVGRDAAEGKLNPADLDEAVTAECRRLFGHVVGIGDPLFPLQADVARQVLAAGGVPADELNEWAAVSRRRAGEAVGVAETAETPDGPVVPADAESTASGAHSPVPADRTSPLSASPG